MSKTRYLDDDDEYGSATTKARRKQNRAARNANTAALKKGARPRARGARDQW